MTDVGRAFPVGSPSERVAVAAPAACALEAADPIDFAQRWAKARAGALARFESADSQAGPPKQRREELLVDVNRRSYEFGRSFARHFGAVDDSGRMVDLLFASGTPCARGERDSRDGVAIVRRPPCAESSETRPDCDFFREALDGFVCGASERLRFSRRFSAVRGAALCEDAIYPASAPSARFAPVPAEIAAHLAPPLERLAARGLAIELMGVAENRVHVCAGGGATTSCGLGRVSFDLLAAHLAARFPDYELIDATPRAVMA